MKHTQNKPHSDAVTASALADFFLRFAQLLEIRGNPDDRYPILAYKRAAETFREYEADVPRLLREGALHTLPGIGAAIERKIQELEKTGKVWEYEQLKKDVPETLLTILDVPFLGPKKAALFYHTLGVRDLISLQWALENGSAATLPGIRQASVQKWLLGIEELESRKRMPRTDAAPIVRRLITTLRKCPSIGKLEVGGSFRRKEKTIGDIDILLTAKSPQKAAACIVALPMVKRVLSRGKTKVSVLLTNNLQVDVRMVGADHFGAALQYFTGSKQHNVELRTIAKKKRLKISEYGVFRGTKKIAGRTEEDVYQAVGLPFIPPEKRLGKGEIERAMQKAKLAQ